VLIFFIAGLLYLLRFERVDNLGAYRIPPETGILIPSVFISYCVTTVGAKKEPPRYRAACVIPKGLDHHFITRKTTLLFSVPLGVVTSTAPVVAPLGTVVLISDFDTTLNVAGVP
jgi:hypothetical protein